MKQQKPNIKIIFNLYNRCIFYWLESHVSSWNYKAENKWKKGNNENSAQNNEEQIENFGLDLGEWNFQ